MGDQEKHWAPHFCCVNCSSRLRRWFAGKNVFLGFAVPMIWKKQKDHGTDCCFCLTSVKGHSHRTRKNIQYPDLPSAIQIVKHSVDFPMPMPPASLPIRISTCSESSSADFEPCQSKGMPHLVTREDLNDLVWDLNLAKGKSEFLGSHLQQWNMLSPGTKFSFYC